MTIKFYKNPDIQTFTPEICILRKSIKLKMSYKYKLFKNDEIKQVIFQNY